MFGTYVHRWIAKAAVPNPDPERLTHVDHINSVKTDNRACNLRWTTRRGNNSTPHAIKMKTKNARFTKRDRQAIKAEKDGKVRYFATGTECAEALGCSTVLVYNAINRRGCARRAKGWTLSWTECGVKHAMTEQHRQAI